MKAFRWLFDGPRLKLTTQLSPEEFTRKFNETVTDPPLLSLTASSRQARPVGRQTGDQFTLQLWRWHEKRPNSPYFRGSFCGVGNGSVIIGQFSCNEIGKGVFATVLGLSLLFAIALLGAFASDLFHGDVDAIWSLLITVFVGGGLITAAARAKAIGQKHEQSFLKFFKETFGASLIERVE